MSLSRNDTMNPYQQFVINIMEMERKELERMEKLAQEKTKEDEFKNYIVEKAAERQEQHKEDVTFMKGLIEVIKAHAVKMGHDRDGILRLVKNKAKEFNISERRIKRHLRKSGILT